MASVAARKGAEAAAEALARETAETLVKQTAKEGAEAAAKEGTSAAAKEGAEAAAKEGAEAAAKEGVEAAAKEGAETAAETAAKAAGKEGVETAAETAAREGAQSAASAAGKGTVDIEKVVIKDLTEAEAKQAATAVAKLEEKGLWKTFVEGSESIKALMWKYPKITALIAAVSIFGIAALSLFAANQNKKLQIKKMESADSTNPTSTTVIITFSPNTRINKKDKIQFKGHTDMIPTHDGDEVKIDKVISNTKIKITLNPLTTYATKGDLELHTSIENCMETTVEETAEIIDKGTGGFLSDIQKWFGAAWNYVVIAIGIIVCIILIKIIMVIVKLFKKKKDD